MEFLNGWRSDAELRCSLSSNGDVRGEPCLAITSGLITALQRLNYGEASESSSSDVDGVRGKFLNPEQGPESEDEMDDVEEVQGRSEEGLEMGGCGNLKETSINVELNDRTSQGTAPDWEQ